MRRWLGQTSGGDKTNEAGDEDIDSTRETKKRNGKWLTGRGWLVLDNENVGMFCKDCRNVNTLFLILSILGRFN